jgi:hypothetical protein
LGAKIDPSPGDGRNTTVNFHRENAQNKKIHDYGKIKYVTL